MDDVVIKAEKLTKSYKLPAEEVFAVRDIDVDIRKADYISLMGPSGSGKTTLLDTLGCLDSISSGRLTVLGQDVSRAAESELVSIRRGRLGFVFQEFLLVPELTALENVELPMTFARMPRDRDRARSLLDRVGLGHRMDHLPRELSGGEQQRVAIARSLAVFPSILFADEPTGHLDTRNSDEVFAVFEELNRDDGLTIVVATHDERLGSKAARVVRLEDGKIVD